jgi:hypothetical protein
MRVGKGEHLSFIFALKEERNLKKRPAVIVKRQKVKGKRKKQRSFAILSGSA